MREGGAGVNGRHVSFDVSRERCDEILGLR
jgi:hypothetical protein